MTTPLIDLVKETTTTSGAITTITTAGAVTNFQPFNTSPWTSGTTGIAVKVGPDSNGAWEIMYVTLTSTGPNVLTKTGLISSSTGSAITFASGTKEVTAVVPAVYFNRALPIMVVVTQSATPAINTDLGTLFSITGLAQAITNLSTNLTGTWVHGQEIDIEITDNASARTIGYGTTIVATTVALPTTTVASTMLRLRLRYNAVTSKWCLIGVA